MTYAPATIVELGALWVAHGGTNLGIVGNATHTYGYHLGQDRLPAGDYSAKTTRDLAGLSAAAAALDLGHADKTELRAFSRWLVTQAQQNAPGTSDLREILYSPDGAVVLRWDRERGYASAPKPGEADSTHLWHTHLSFYRDSESRSKLVIFEPYWAGADMQLDPHIYTADVADFTPGATVYRDGARTQVFVASWAGGPSVGVVGDDKTNAYHHASPNVCINLYEPAPPNARALVYVGADHMVNRRPRVVPAPPPPDQSALAAAELAGRQAGFDLAVKGAVVDVVQPQVHFPPRPA